MVAIATLKQDFIKNYNINHNSLIADNIKKLNSLEEIFKIFERQLQPNSLIFYMLYDSTNIPSMIKTTKNYLVELCNIEYLGMSSVVNGYPKFKNVNVTHN